MKWIIDRLFKCGRIKSESDCRQTCVGICCDQFSAHTGGYHEGKKMKPDQISIEYDDISTIIKYRDAIRLGEQTTLNL